MYGRVREKDWERDGEADAGMGGHDAGWEGARMDILGGREMREMQEKEIESRRGKGSEHSTRSSKRLPGG